MKAFITSLAFATLLAGCSSVSPEQAISMSPDKYIQAATVHPLSKVETIGVSRATTAIENSFRHAAAKCLKRREVQRANTFGDAELVTDYLPKVYRDGNGVVLEIQIIYDAHRAPNRTPRRLFLAKATPSSNGNVVTMVGPRVAHDAIFTGVQAWARGQNAPCFKYPGT